MVSSVLATSVLGTIRIFIILVVGFFASKWPKAEALLSREACRLLSRVCAAMFLPALILATTASTLTPTALRDSWQLLVANGFTIGISLLTASGCERLFLRKEDRRSFRPIRLAVAFSNVAAFPLLLLAALCEQDVINSDYEDAQECYATATSMIFIYALGWQVSFHGWAFYSLREYEASSGPDETSHDQHPPPAPRNNNNNNNNDIGGVGGIWAKNGLKRRMNQIFKSPSILAVLCGVFIAMIAPLQERLFQRPQSVLRPLGAAVQTIGTPFVAVQMLVMAGSLAQAPGPVPAAVVSGGGEGSAETVRHERILMGIFLVACRLIAVPMVGFSIFWVARTQSSVQGTNRLMHLIMLIQFAMPSSPYIIVSLNQLKQPAIAGLVARLYLWQYGAAVVTITLWTALAVYVVY